MSLIAGRLTGQVAAQFLLASEQGLGLLLGGAPGARPARVLVMGGGVVGTESARMAVGLHADVTILQRSSERLRQLDEIFRGRVRTLHSDPHTLAELLPDVDVVIGAVLLPSARAPELIDRDALARLRPGTLLIDVAIDQGGCFETSQPTTHAEPIVEIDGVRHYCVTNMPAAVPVTATAALTGATLPYVIALADAGVDAAFDRLPGLAAGVNVRDGRLLLDSAMAVS
jgi:alanine dehydrogenase